MSNRIPFSRFTINRRSPQAAGLIAWWPVLIGRSGNILRDLGGRGLNGTFRATGEPAWQSDLERGVALDFDGGDDYISISDNDALDVATNFTLTAWINPNSLGGGSNARVVDKASSNPSIDGYIFALTGTNAIFIAVDAFAAGGFITSSDNAFGFNEWTHIAATVDAVGTGVVLYANGRNVGSGTLGVAIGTNAIAFTIGNRAGDYARAFDGSIDDVRVFDRVLSAVEVYQIYDPATRWDLYLPLRKALLVVLAAAPSIVALDEGGLTGGLQPLAGGVM